MSYGCGVPEGDRCVFAFQHSGQMMLSMRTRHPAPRALSTCCSVAVWQYMQRMGSLSSMRVFTVMIVSLRTGVFFEKVDADQKFGQDALDVLGLPLQGRDVLLEDADLDTLLVLLDAARVAHSAAPNRMMRSPCRSSQSIQTIGVRPGARL